MELSKVLDTDVAAPMFELTTMLPSEREKTIIEQYLVDRKISSCVKVFKERWGREIRPSVVSNWLKRPQVVQVIKREMLKRALAEGMDERTWKALGTDQMLYEGKALGYGKFDSLRTFYWKELGKALGYYKDGDGAVVNTNIVIRQADGQE